MSTVNPISSEETSRLLPDASAADIDAAMAYEKIFVPALFQYWPGHLISSAGVQSGDRTLDIACGTGVLTRQLTAIVGEAPAPVGLDISAGMLDVAHRLNPAIEWRQGDATALPFEDASFDRILCQYGLMFFTDRAKALAEMARVLVRGGRLALSVWNSLENNPGFLTKVDVLDRVAGHRAGDALRSPFCLGDREALWQIADRAGLHDIEIETLTGEARFRNMREFVEAEVRGWLPVMDVHLSEDVIAAVHAECRENLGRYENGPGGSLAFPVSAHIVTASHTRE